MIGQINGERLMNKTDVGVRLKEESESDFFSLIWSTVKDKQMDAQRFCV